MESQGVVTRIIGEPQIKHSDTQIERVEEGPILALENCGGRDVPDELVEDPVTICVGPNDLRPGKAEQGILCFLRIIPWGILDVSNAWAPISSLQVAES